MKAWLPLLSLALLAACGSEDERPRLNGPVPLPECPEASYEPCDIRKAACQAGLAELAACLRESSAPPEVAIELMSETEYASVVRAGYADVPEPTNKHFDTALSRFGLAPRGGVPRADDIFAFVAKLGGVYRGHEKRIVIIDHGEPADDELSNLILLHELVHALQDAEHDLLHWPDDEPLTFDSALARRTVVEGEASFYEARAAVPFLGLDIADVDFEMAMQQRLDRTLEGAFEAELLLSNSFVTVTYGMGALVSFHAWQEGGPSGIEPLWQAPPRTMQRVMSAIFGQNTPVDAGIDIPAPDIADLEPYADEVLGAWGLNLTLGQAAKTHDSVPLALTWRGDRFSVYTDTNESTFALWQLELESPEAAQKLDEFFASSGATTHETAGSRLFVSYGIDVEASPSLTEWGRAWLAEQ